MKIMYINDVGFDTNNGSNRIILSMLTKFLQSEITVYYVAAHSEGLNDDIPNELLKFSNFSYDIIQKPVANKSAFIKRFFHSIKFEFNARKRYKKKMNDVDLILLQSHYTSFLTVKLLKKFKKKIVFNIFDIFPGISFESSGLPNKIVYKTFLFLQKIIYKNCSKFFTLTEDTKNSLNFLGVDKNKIEIIPNWYEENVIREVSIENNDFIKKYNLDVNKKYIQYAGSVGVSYDFDYVVQVAEKLSYRNDIIFQIVGEGYKLNNLKANVQKRGLMNFQFIPWQSESTLSNVYSACTLQIIPLISNVIYNSFPSKILPLMGCSRTAVICVDKNSYFYREFNEKRIAKCVDIGDVDKAVEFILEICDNEDLKQEFEHNALKYVKKHYTMNMNTDKMIKTFKELMEE